MARRILTSSVPTSEARSPRTNRSVVITPRVSAAHWPTSLDLSRKRTSLLRWLGRNRFTGYNEYRAFEGGSLGFQEAASSTNAWMGTVASRNSTPLPHLSALLHRRRRRPERRLRRDRIAQAPVYTAPAALLQRRDRSSGSPTRRLTIYYYNAGRYNKRILSTYGGVWQGYFWDGRIVPLYGRPS